MHELETSESVSQANAVHPQSCVSRGTAPENGGLAHCSMLCANEITKGHGPRSSCSQNPLPPLPRPALQVTPWGARVKSASRI